MCIIRSRCGVVTLGQFEKFKMATNVTENQPTFLKIKLVTQTVVDHIFKYEYNGATSSL